MKKVRHIQSVTTRRKDGVVVRQSSVYLPLKKEDKLKVMGKDYSLGGEVYKKTTRNGLVSIGDKPMKTKIFIVPAIKGERVIPFRKFNKKGEILYAFVNKK